MAEALHETLIIESQGIAEYLSVDERTAHPDEPLDAVARACGYASDNSLWRFLQRKLGITATGKKSLAGPERFDEMRKASRRRYRY